MEKVRKNMVDEEESPSSLQKIKNNFLSESSRKEKQEQIAQMKSKSELGAIQIARFHEMGALDLEKDVAQMPGASAEYLAQIREIHAIRSSLQRFETGRISNEEIAELRQIGEKIKLSKILSSDEIENANHNIEVDLTHEVFLKEYIRGLAMMVGRKKLRKATAADDPRRYISFILQLKDCGLLMDTDLMQLPHMPLENIMVLLAELKSNARYLNEQDSLRIERSNNARAQMLELQKVAVKVEKIMEKAAQKADFEILLEAADIVTDNVLAFRMGQLRMTLPAIEKIEGMAEGEKRALLMVAKVNYDRTWDDVRGEYRTLAVELAKIEVKKILACDDSDRRLAILEKLVGKGVIGLTEIGMDLEQIKAGVEQTRALTRQRIQEAKMNGIREKYKNLSAKYRDEFDNLDYLREIHPEAISDPDEAEFARSMILNLSNEKMAIIMDNLSRNEDVDYMNTLVGLITAAVPDVDKK